MKDSKKKNIPPSSAARVLSLLRKQKQLDNQNDSFISEVMGVPLLGPSNTAIVSSLPIVRESSSPNIYLWGYASGRSPPLGFLTLITSDRERTILQNWEGSGGVELFSVRFPVFLILAVRERQYNYYPNIIHPSGSQWLHYPCSIDKIHIHFQIASS